MPLFFTTAIEVSATALSINRIFHVINHIPKPLIHPHGAVCGRDG